MRIMIRERRGVICLVSDQDMRFTGEFWRGLCKHLDFKQRMSTAYHPKTGGQPERASRPLELLRYALGAGGKSEHKLCPRLSLLIVPGRSTHNLSYPAALRRRSLSVSTFGFLQLLRRTVCGFRQRTRSPWQGANFCEPMATKNVRRPQHGAGGIRRTERSMYNY